MVDLHTTTSAAEVERDIAVTPDILFSHCFWLGFDFGFGSGVVAP